MSEQALQKYESGALDAHARKSAIDDMLNKVALVMETMDRVMKDGEHYGKVPGCGDKKILFKAGAEKLGLTFRLKPTFDVQERDLGNYHREYRVTCTLTDGTQGVGTCSTLEAKYRYRKVYKGNQAERVEHDNPADNWNTCLKMGKKRAHVDAIITATASSDILTQDLEDIVQAADATGDNKTVAVSVKVTRESQPERPTAPAKAPAAVADPQEGWKQYFLKEIKKRKWEIFAWKWAVANDWIKVYQQLALADNRLFPNTRADVGHAFAKIKVEMDEIAGTGGVSQELEEAYTAAHLEEAVDVPAINTAAAPAWKSVVLHFGPAEGTKLGDLDQKKMYGWCMNYEPKPYKGKIGDKDAALRKALDEARDYYGFKEKGEKAAPAPKPTPHLPVDDTGDEVPF